MHAHTRPLKTLMNFSPAITVLAMLACLSCKVQAQTPSSNQLATQSAKTAAESKGLASAQVVKVYPKEKRILLKHGPIPDLGMSAMTMEFGVRNAKMLNSLKPGDAVKFTAEQVKGDFVVTSIEVVK